MQLYDYQKQGVEDLRDVYRSGKRAALYVLPTGGGKTVVLAHVAASAARRGLRVGLVAHRRELVGQISKALTAWNQPHGVIAPDAPPLNDAVQVAMAQTLCRRLPLDKSGRYRFDLLIFDEAHHVTRDTGWGVIAEHSPDARMLGVTATPSRLDGKGLGVDAGGFWDALVVGPTVRELIERGRLATPIIYQPEARPDLSGVKKKGGDYVVSQLAGAMDKVALTGNAVEHYRSVCAGAPAVAFCVTTAHAEHVRVQFAEAGFAAATLTGKTPDKERCQMLADLASGTLQVLTSCNVVSEGTDIPAVAAAILLRPTASFALAMQQMGRALRVLPDKSHAHILDHAGNTLAHGAPDDPVDWRLDGFSRSSKSRAFEMRPCRMCGSSTFVDGSAACSVCGFSFRRDAAPSVVDAQLSLPMEVGGNLVLLDAERRAFLLAKRAWRDRALAAAHGLGDLQAIGAALGYKPDWANYEFKRMERRQG